MFIHPSRDSKRRGRLNPGALLGLFMIGASASCSGNVQLDPTQTNAGGSTAQSSPNSTANGGGSTLHASAPQGGNVQSSSPQSALTLGGSVAQSEVTRGGNSAVQSEVTRGGSSAVQVSTIDCGHILCFRAVECVASCGGPVLQSGCCPCPTGTFDSIECLGAGGAGGQSTAAVGGSSTGVGGKSSSTSAGGAAAGGSSGTGIGLECKTDQDCQLTGDCCGCHSLPINAQSDCAAPCATHPGSCADVGYLTQKAEPTCVWGHCVLKRNCDDSLVTCNTPAPVCPTGRVPGVTADGRCWDGDCINVEECSEVSSCSVCKDNNLMCVYENGARGVAHCVKEPGSCTTNTLCACYGALCNGISPCSDLQYGNYGIGCGGG